MIDYESAIIEQLWDVLEDNNVFTSMVSPNNRIKLFAADDDAEDEGASPFKTTWNDGDFPECTIITTDLVDTFWTLAPTYATRRRSAAQAAMPVDLTITVAIEIVHLNLNYFQRRKLDNAVLKSLRAAGPVFGITDFPIRPAGPLTRRGGVVSSRTGEVANAGGMRRLTSLMTMPVTVRTTSTDLLS